MTRLKDQYQKEIMPKLKEELGVKSILATPKINKIVVSVGVGDAKDNQSILDGIVANIAALAGQKPVVNRAKGSISNFKLAKGQPIGVSVTLRGDRMYEFLDKLISIVLPKVRDFRGLSDKSFDNQGNFTIGLKEQALFPEVSFQNSAVGGKTRGMEVTVVTSANSKADGKKLLELMGVPFIKG